MSSMKATLVLDGRASCSNLYVAEMLFLDHLVVGKALLTSYISKYNRHLQK